MTDQQESDAPMSVPDEPLQDPAVPTARELDLLRQLALKQQEVDDLAVSLEPSCRTSHGWFEAFRRS